jgi:hypothetical protein
LRTRLLTRATPGVTLHLLQARQTALLWLKLQLTFARRCCFIVILRLTRVHIRVWESSVGALLFLSLRITFARSCCGHCSLPGRSRHLAKRSRKHLPETDRGRPQPSRGSCVLLRGWCCSLRSKWLNVWQGADALAAVRRQLGYFEVRSKWIGVAELPPDAAPPDLGVWSNRVGAALIGVTTGWVTNLNVLLSSISLEAARPIARAVSGRYGGIVGVQSMALQVQNSMGCFITCVKYFSFVCSIGMELKLLAMFRTVWICQWSWKRFERRWFLSTCCVCMCFTFDLPGLVEERGSREQLRHWLVCPRSVLEIGDSV